MAKRPTPKKKERRKHGGVYDAESAEASRKWLKQQVELVNELAAGWQIFDIGNRLEIQRDDSSPTFKTDDEALAHVKEAAANGSLIAIIGLYLDGRDPKDDRFFWPGNPFGKETGNGTKK